MSLTSAEHRQILAATKRLRNEAARARRAAPVELVRCVDVGGEVVLVALSRRTPQLGYILRPGGDGRLQCPCRGYAFRGDCAHVQATGLGTMVLNGEP